MEQRHAPMEFNEVASMAMELLASPYLTKDKGGYFSEGDASRYRIDHLKGIIEFWPYMAVVVAFQHWIYTNHDLATDPEACDKKWLELWGRFMKNADYTGHEAYIKNRWRRQGHIYRRPFYYVEYGLAQLGAVQVWANALKDQQSALDAYRKALALGGTVKLPELYEAANVKLAFDAETLQSAVTLLESTIDELEALAH
jgi:oligoendopeptidase F